MIFGVALLLCRALVREDTLRQLTKFRINLSGYTGIFKFLLFVVCGLAVIGIQRNNGPTISVDITLQQFAKSVGTIGALDEFWPFMEEKFMATAFSYV